MSVLRFAVFGAGFWTRYQLAAWQEVEGAQCVAIYNRTRSNAEHIANEFAIPRVYDSANRLLNEEAIDFVDIITDVSTHHDFVLLAAAHGIPAICQKPLAESVASAGEMVSACEAAAVPLLVHENWRWQSPIRAVHKLLEDDIIGNVFRARIQYSNCFPVFENQPFLKEVDRLILLDIGVHILDSMRFLFGESKRLYCQAARVHADIRGEDVATIMLEMENKATVVCELSYATRFEHERFPETLILIEGERGSIELSPDYWVRVTTASGTEVQRYPPKNYPWADPAYGVVHASIVDCHRNLLGSLRGVAAAETTGTDNLRTLQLVEAAYTSWQRSEPVTLTALGGIPR